MIRYVLLVIILLSVYSCHNNTNIESGQTPPEDKVVDDRKTKIVTSNEDSIEYESFKSNFPELALGDFHKKGTKLSKYSFLENYFVTELTNEQIKAGAKLELYAVGKIINYKGFDIFIIDEESIPPDEDSYDNHVDQYRFLMLFKDGKIVSSKDNSLLIHPMNSHYYGEGGESSYYSFFDKDSTIVTIENTSESESATGYATSIDAKKEYRWRITKSGEKDLLEVTRIELSSDFYTQSYIDAIEEDDGSWRNYPTEDDKLSLSMNLSLFSSIDLLNLPITIKFYYKELDGKLRIIFESVNSDHEIIDKYIVGISDKNQRLETEARNKNPFMRCPVIIKASNSDIEILSNGHFLKRF